MSNSTGSTPIPTQIVMSEPPLLPAFVITGLFMCAAMSLLGWRYVQWHNHPQATTSNREPSQTTRQYDQEMRSDQRPTLWELWVRHQPVGSEERPVMQLNNYLNRTWKDLLPLSVSVVDRMVNAPSQDGDTDSARLQVACIVSMPNPCVPLSQTEPTVLQQMPQEYAIGTVNITTSIKFS